MPDDGDLHPIELIAHSVLNEPLDSLHENFELLHKSQVILLTRLKLIEQKLEKYGQQQANQSLGNSLPITEAVGKIRSIKKRLQEIDKVLDKIDKRVDKL